MIKDQDMEFHGETLQVLVSYGDILRILLFTRRFLISRVYPPTHYRFLSLAFLSDNRRYTFHVLHPLFGLDRFADVDVAFLIRLSRKELTGRSLLNYSPIITTFYGATAVKW